jgi:DNA polymerase-3 subunit alpha
LRFGLLSSGSISSGVDAELDIDFARIAHEVIRYVQQKYGRARRPDHHLRQIAGLAQSAMSAGHGALRAGRPVVQVRRNNPAHRHLEQAIAGEPALQHQRDTDETVAWLMTIALKLEGSPAGLDACRRPRNRRLPAH